MATAPKNEVELDFGRRRFADPFEIDLKFFQLFFSLINKTSPFQNIDLVWAERGPARRVGLPGVVSTDDTLRSACTSLLGRSESPEPSFCNLVNDFGRRMAESCAKSDRAAEERVRVLGRAQVYRCHAGLTDIAVPVICDGQHIATLLTGQVLREPPSESGLVQIRKNLAHLTYIEQEKLEKAYWRVPVVSQEDIDNAIQVLEIFAEYLAISWKRLSEAVENEHRKARELQLLRKEFAHAVLEKQFDSSAMHELTRKLGFTASPNRALIIRLESEEEYYTRSGAFDLAFTAALQGIEEACEAMQSLSWAYLPKRGVIVFFCDAHAEGPGRSEFQAHRLAQHLLHAIRERSDLRVRIGIGRAESDVSGLVDSYHEASIALATSTDTIATYQQSSVTLRALSAALENVSSLLAERRFQAAKASALALPALVGEHLGATRENFAPQRQFFGCALDSMLFDVQELGCSTKTLAQVRAEAYRSLDRAECIFELHQAFLEFADRVIDEARQVFLGKREKVIHQACRMIEQQLRRSHTAHSVSLPGIASALGISAGHLSRTFKRTMGITFERYLMAERVESAKRFLLDPSNRVVDVSDRCGFSDPTYFAKVFRRFVGCAPSDYAKDPIRYAGPPPHSALTPHRKRETN